MNYSVTQLAMTLGIRRQSVDKMLREKRIPASVFLRGKKRLIRRTKALDDWLKTRMAPDFISSPAKKKMGELEGLQLELENANKAVLEASSIAANVARKLGFALTAPSLRRKELNKILDHVGISGDSKRRLRKWSKTGEVTPESLKTPASISKALKAAGAITPKTKSEEKLHTIPTVTEIFINFQMDWNEALNAARKIQDVRKWDRDTCEKVNRQLQPIVDLYNTNAAKCQ